MLVGAVPIETDFIINRLSYVDSVEAGPFNVPTRPTPLAEAPSIRRRRPPAGRTPFTVRLTAWPAAVQYGRPRGGDSHSPPLERLRIRTNRKIALQPGLL